jgi:hypothetical protein
MLKKWNSSRLIETAVLHYSEKCDYDDRETINTCLEFIKFGMSNTLLSFQDKYYIYDGDLNPEEKGLSIGGYESAWLADLAMSYILNEVEVKTTLLDRTGYFQIYRDDGIAIFPGKYNYQDLNEWLFDFQEEVNEIAGNDYLQFTAVLWDPSNSQKDVLLNDKVEVIKDQTFPFLDMELSWNDVTNELTFGVYIKPNQELKYLNKTSIHTPNCLKAIPNGVCQRLAKLTSIDESNKDKKLSEIYPIHFDALGKAGLIQPEQAPTLGMLKAAIEQSENSTTPNWLKKRRERDNKRAIWFKIGFSNYWRVPIHKTIKRVKGKFNSLKWLRVKMSYHRFTNLRELFQGDLTAKINAGLKSIDFEELKCNCRKSAKNEKNVCIYNGKCRTSIVVYKATCEQTGKVYIGNTQQHLKKRMQQHVQDVKNLVKKDKKSDSFAAHFAPLIPRETDAKNVRNLVKFKCDILWKGDPISCVKTFGSKACKLCAKERLEILKLTVNEKEKAINSCNEIFGACRHKPRFHRFNNTETPSTDESVKDERVYLDSTTSRSTNASTPSFASSPLSPEIVAIKHLSLLSTEEISENIVEGLRARFRYSSKGSPATSVVGEIEFPTNEVTGEPLDMNLSEVEAHANLTESEPDIGQSLF